MKKLFQGTIALLLLASVNFQQIATAQITVFTYQGRLDNNGEAANGQL